MQCNLLQYDFDIMSHVVISSHCYVSKMCQTLANQNPAWTKLQRKQARQRRWRSGHGEEI